MPDNLHHCLLARWTRHRGGRLQPVFIDVSSEGAGEGKLKVQSSKLKISSRSQAPKSGDPCFRTRARATSDLDALTLTAVLSHRMREGDSSSVGRLIQLLWNLRKTGLDVPT